MPAHESSTLFETDRGRVRRCPCCDRLELRFGNALLALAPDDLPQVLAQLDTAGAAAPPEAPGEVTLFLGDSGCGWVFAADEAAELHRLLAGAGLLLDLAA